MDKVLDEQTEGIVIEWKDLDMVTVKEGFCVALREQFNFRGIEESVTNKMKH